MKSPVEIEKFDTYYHYHHNGDYCFEGHSHKAWEINVVTKGVLSVTYDDRVITLKKNMMLVCEGDTFHRNRVVSSDGVELFVYQFTIGSIPHGKTPRVYKLDEKSLFLVDMLREEAEKNSVVSADGAIKSKFPNYQATKYMELLLIRLMENEANVYYEAHPDEKLYKGAVNFMKDNIDKNICIGDIANHCHVSPTKIKTLFTEFTGEAIMTHFYNMKINEAKKMLAEGMSAGEVSDALGYSSQAYLTTVFKKATGKSPKNFKKSDS